MRRLAFSVLALALVACDGGDGPMLSEIAPQSVPVNEELMLQIPIDNPTGQAVELRVQNPELPAFETVTRLTTEPGGGVFRWSPLSSHVGTHDVVFELTDGGDTVYDSRTAVIEVLPCRDCAPVFVQPGPGGTYDLERDPCVRFDIEVLDDDSADVDISARSELPDRASLNPAGPKRATFDWCPTPDQVAASERYTVQLQADDGTSDRDPVEHDYVVVLRSGDKEGCPGADPQISVSSPAMGEALRSGTTYPVEITVTDDMGLRDPPLLYYTINEPESLEEPDVTQFEQIVFEEDGGSFVARIPDLGLEEDAMQEVWFLVSATDNDDPNGSVCDHRTDSAVVSFFAVGGAPADASLEQCDFCSESAECASGVCASTATGGRCVDACSDGMCSSGVCGATPTVEGGVRAGCGPVSEICGGSSGMCTNDGNEPNDTVATATAYASTITDGQICEGDLDHYSVSVPPGNRVAVALAFANSSGDLDLTLRAADGTILDTSASTRDMEEVEYCNSSGSNATYVARVEGYRTAENSYSLDAVVAPDAAMCCTEDMFEEDDSQMAARSITFGAGMGGTETAAFDGTVCAGDDDWIRIPMSGPGRIEVDLVFVHADGDIDIRLHDPSGTRIASGLSTSDDESIGVDVAGGGDYALRISVYGTPAGVPTYLGEVRRITGMGCASTDDCPRGTMCDGGSCVDDRCMSGMMCPTMHICMPAGPIPAAPTCGVECSVNSDCRGGEACKWNEAGRGCGDTGSGQNGDACTTFGDCGGQRSCVGWTGGYCARVGCSDNSDCESGTYCVTEGGLNVCAKSCVIDPCRSAQGYMCRFRPTLGGTSRFVCLP